MAECVASAYSDQGHFYYGSADTTSPTPSATYSQSSGSFTDSPIYRAESWERVVEPGLDSSRQTAGSCIYHTSPRITKKQAMTHRPRIQYSSRCTDCCSDMDTCTTLEERCLIWKSLCCSSFKKNSRSCQIRKIYRQYFFLSKGLVVVLILNALFSTAVFGVTTEVLKVVLGPEYLLTRTLLVHGITQLMFPIAGHLADQYIGRHSVIRFSLWMAFIGLALLGIAFSFDDYNNEISAANRFVILPITALLLSTSYVCFMSNLIPFGLDQLQGASHIHHSSFFYWWYWTLNIGIVFVNMPQYCMHNVEIDVLIQAEIGLVCITLAIILDALLKHWFVIEPICKKNNPLIQIATILKEACKLTKTQRIPSVVFHEVNIQRFGRMDRMKKRYGGKYETEEVEDVRTFFRILIVLIGVGFSTLIYAGVFDTIGLMASNMNGTLAHLSIATDLCKVEISLMGGTNAVILVILIPILDLLIVPILRHTICNPNILHRLGLGSFLAFVTVLSMFVMRVIGDKSSRACMFNTTAPLHSIGVDVYWLLLPLITITIAEVFIYIPGFEFICAQAPYNMRGLLIGVFFSVQGIFSLVSVLLQYLFMTSLNGVPFETYTRLSCGSWYYLILVCLAIFGLLFYIVASCKYKNRKRDDVINEVTLIEEYFISAMLRRN